VSSCFDNVHTYSCTYVQTTTPLHASFAEYQLPHVADSMVDAYLFEDMIKMHQTNMSDVISHYHSLCLSVSLSLSPGLDFIPSCGTQFNSTPTHVRRMLYIYSALVEIVSEEFEDEEHRVVKFFCFVLGAVAMGTLGFWV
jgi:hypothetical protein